MPHHLLNILVFFLAVVAGAVASISGFGIGSLLTPLLATTLGMKSAIAAVSVPHLAATAARFWSLRRHVDRRVLAHFGIASAAGGLFGALFHSKADSPILSTVFGALLLFTGLSGLAGWMDRMRFRRSTAWLAGVLSGIFGGLVGNQGGIRSAALLSFQMPKESLVATATATGIIIDLVRVPVYLGTETQDLLSAKTTILLATGGCLIGTFWGVGLLKRIPPPRYKQALSLFIGALGLFMIIRTWI